MKGFVQLVLVLMVLGFIIENLGWILAVVGLCLAGWGAYAAASAYARHRSEVNAAAAAREVGLIARAEIQHRQYLAGESGGIYGDYRPADLD